MDRDFLKQCLDSGMSLPQIGAMVGRDASTVGYWVKKHGLRANGQARYAPRGGLTRAQLEPLVESGLTLRQIAKQLDCSVSTVRHWLAKFGLETKRRHRNGELARAAKAAGMHRFDGNCRKHGPGSFLLFPGGTYRCARCNSEHVAARRRRAKRALVEDAGGCCQICGYDRYMGALQFHHRDPASKQFSISRRGATIAIARSRAEARKCVLLCANCHAEVEAGIASLTEP